MIPLIEKYRAKTFEEIKGQDIAAGEIRAFLRLFPKKRALILNGPVGTGKTSFALALARAFNLEIFELNASDLRNRKSLEEVLRPSLEQQSLFKKGKIILMDEADGITTSDRGGLPELIALITKTPFPIIITSNDIWDRKFSLLRQRCQIINLKPVSEEIIKTILKEVSIKENNPLSEKIISLVSRKSRGDVRAALNDLQSIINLGEESFLEDISEREKQESIFEALKRIFQEETNQGTIRAYDSTQMDLDEIMLWIEENIPLAYQGKALAKAYDSLSKADIFKGRIYRQQYWRFLVYQNFFLSAGISSATKIKYLKFTKYNKPSRILKIWLSNQKNAKRKSIIAKYSKFCHHSKKKAAKESFLLPLILDNLDTKTRKKLNLDEKEDEYLRDKKAAIIIANNLNRFKS
jgi:replication factor C large subunit